MDRWGGDLRPRLLDLLHPFKTPLLFNQNLIVYIIISSAGIDDSQVWWAGPVFWRPDNLKLLDRSFFLLLPLSSFISSPHRYLLTVSRPVSINVFLLLSTWNVMNMEKWNEIDGKSFDKSHIYCRYFRSHITVFSPFWSLWYNKLK